MGKILRVGDKVRLDKNGRITKIIDIHIEGKIKFYEIKKGVYIRANRLTKI
ncbi:MAG: hypothetical protein GY861_24240 [bacterium]|nr:hypothetical protein [bacterium]